MMMYSYQRSLLPQPNKNDGLTMNTVDTDKSVSPAPNIMSLSALTTTTYPHVSNYTSMMTKSPNILPIPHHTKKYLLSNTLLFNAKSCDTADPTKPSSPPIPICPEIVSLMILDTYFNDTTYHPLSLHKGQHFPSSESYKSAVTCYGTQMKY